MKTLIIITFLATSCVNSNIRQDAKSSFVSVDSLKQASKSEAEIIDIRFNIDTLNIVSTMDVLYYPFGVFDNFQSFFAQHISNSDGYRIDSIKKAFKIYTVQSNLNKVKLLEHSDTKRIELLSAEIKKGDIVMFDDIYVGVSRRALLSKFFMRIPEQCLNISVMQLRSGLAGVWYTFYFADDTLKGISIKTDYVLNE